MGWEMNLMLSSRGCLKQMFGHFGFSEMWNGVILWFSFLCLFIATERLKKMAIESRQSIHFVVLAAKYGAVGNRNMESISAYGKMCNSHQREYRLLCRSKKCSEFGNKQLCSSSKTKCTTGWSFCFSWNATEVEKKNHVTLIKESQACKRICEGELVWLCE